eukprot:TRINITY_DN10818_c0_g1_i1.p1 TRINITY_DN10818_c0_g1~~TRINITY_DN10818_c0_g1_i1.p1  ORF type:complete len:302 (+),score=40.40 TRINITY_DN10818_c0_g1_i1:108-1013(+)
MDKVLAASEFKIGIVGYKSCGKSSFSIRWATDHFPLEENMLSDSWRKQIDFEGEKVIIDLGDCMGAYEDIDAMRPENKSFFGVMDRWLLVPDAFFIAFDVTDRESFNKITEARDGIMHRRRIEFFHNMNDCPMLLLALKCDDVSNRKVSADEIQRVADDWGTIFIEASAKTNTNVEEAFKPLLRWVMIRKRIVGTQYVRKHGQKKVEQYGNRRIMEEYWPQISKDAVDPEMFKLISNPHIPVSTSRFISDLTDMMYDEQYTDLALRSSDDVIILAHKFVLYSRGFLITELEAHQKQHHRDP